MKSLEKTTLVSQTSLKVKVLADRIETTAPVICKISLRFSKNPGILGKIFFCFLNVICPTVTEHFG